jgi:hypothetical protein
MTKKIIANDIAMIFPEVISRSLDITQVKIKLADSYQGTPVNPAVVSLPNVTNVIVPEAQLTLIFTDKKFVTIAQTLGELDAEAVSKYITLAQAIKQDVINQAAVAYGFNYAYELKNDVFENLARPITEKYFKPIEIPDANFRYALPVIVFEKNTAKYTLKFEQVIEKPTSEESPVITVNVNVHFNGDIPEGMHETYLETEQYVSGYIGSIFKQ